MSKRQRRVRGKEATLKEKAVAALLAWLKALGDPIDTEHAKAMTVDQLWSLFHFDHAVPKALGGTNHPTNLNPLFRRAHIDKTGKKDRPMIAKVDRISDAHEAFKRRLLTASGIANEPAITRRLKKAGKIPSRPFQKSQRKMQSRPMRHPKV